MDAVTISADNDDPDAEWRIAGGTMSKTRTQQAAVEVATKIPGFAGVRPRIRRLTCDWIETAENEEQLWADVNVKMTIADVDELGQLIASDPTYSQLWEVLAPRVVGWNAVAFDLESQSWVPVKPPAETGVDAFRAVDPIVSNWLAFALKAAALGGDVTRPKASESTPEQPSESD